MTRRERDAAIVAVSMAVLTAVAQYGFLTVFGPGALLAFWAGAVLFMLANVWSSAVRRKYERRGE